MTIKYFNGNVLRSKLRGIAIPVNTMGIPGAGLAKQWAVHYPVEASTYKAACNANAFRVGNILPIKSNSHLFLCFPTKIVPQKRSELVWIEDGLSELKRLIPRLHIESLAIPALGCGLGGLSWQEVRPLIEEHLGDQKIPIHVYLPKSQPRRLS